MQGYRDLRTYKLAFAAFCFPPSAYFKLESLSS